MRLQWKRDPFVTNIQLGLKNVVVLQRFMVEFATEMMTKHACLGDGGWCVQVNAEGPQAFNWKGLLLMACHMPFGQNVEHDAQN